MIGNSPFVSFEKFFINSVDLRRKGCPERPPFSFLNSKLIVEEVIGENAILASRDVTWKEGNSDRRVNRRGAGSGPGSAKAKYLYYLIYENAVIMCEGLNEEESIKLCNKIIK